MSASERNDIKDYFEFLEEHLVYVDAPLEGFSVRSDGLT